MRRLPAMVFLSAWACLMQAVPVRAADPADDTVGQGPWVTAIAPLGDDRSYVVATAEGLLLREATVYRIAADAPQTMQPLYQHPAGVWAVAVSPDGQRIASSDYRGNLVVYDVPSQQATTHEGALQRWTRALAFSPDGDRLVGGNEAGQVIVWSLESAAAEKTIELDAHAIMDVAFAPNGEQLAITDGGGHLHLLRWPSLEESTTAEISGEAAWSIAFVDGPQMLVGAADNRVYRLSAGGESAAASEAAKATDWVTDLAVADSGLVAAAELGGAVLMLDATGQPLGPPVEAASGVWALCWAGNDQLLVGTRKHGVQVLRQSWAWAEPAELTLTAQADDQAAADAPPADADPAEQPPQAAEQEAAEDDAGEEKAAQEEAAGEKTADEKASEEAAAEEETGDEKASEEPAAEEKAAGAQADAADEKGADR